MWTEERIERAKALCADGKSATQIAADLGGVTRNAVIGKLRRLNLYCRGGRGGGQHGRGGRSRKDGQPRVLRHLTYAPKPKKRPAWPWSPAATESKPPTIVREPTPPPDARMVPLADLEAGDCRWPIGDPKEPGFAFCGCRRSYDIANLPYCRYHTEIGMSAEARRKFLCQPVREAA